jgi:hypothetical protein
MGNRRAHTPVEYGAGPGILPGTCANLTCAYNGISHGKCNPVAYTHFQ